MVLRNLSILCILAFVFGCSAPNAQDGELSQATETEQIIIQTRDGFVFEPLPGKSVTGAGITIESNKNVRLVNASMNGVTVELHDMSMEGGRMRMRQVDAFDITADIPFELGSSGPHLMIFGVESLSETVEIQLEFANDAGQKTQANALLLLRKR